MRPLLLLGGGGHCLSCIDVIEAEGAFTIEGLVLPSSAEHEPVLGYPVLGSDENLQHLLVKTRHAFITVGQIQSAKSRIRLFDLLKRLGAELPVIRSPNCYCSRHATVEPGSILMHASVVNARAHIGFNCIVNSHALIEHGVTIGDHCHVSTGARVNGDVTIGAGSFIGSGAVIKEGVKIGSNVFVGAGQVVLEDLPSDTRHTNKLGVLYAK
jgi:sugar O-acyltransferase (sialic acid O-acetyltransferase NeuD family)